MKKIILYVILCFMFLFCKNVYSNPITPINGFLQSPLNGNQEPITNLLQIIMNGPGGTSITFEDSGGNPVGGITNSLIDCQQSIFQDGMSAYYITTNLAPAISAVTNFVADFSKPAMFIAMSTIGANVNFTYTTNWINDTNYQEGFMLILGDGTHSLAFSVPNGENIWTPTNSITTNGVIPANGKIYELAYSRFKIPGIITNTSYALVAPNQ